MNILPETLKASLQALQEKTQALAVAQEQYDALLLQFARQELGQASGDTFAVATDKQTILPYKAELLGNRIRLTGYVMGKDGQATGLRRSTLTEITLN